MELRPYTPDDADACAALFYDTVHSVNAADYTPEQLDAWAPAHRDPAQWASSFAGHYALVAQQDGEIVGFGDVDSTGYLDRLYVHRAHQRQGVATALCDALEACAPGRITTHASMTALPFFRSRGYEVVKRQQVERFGILLTNFVMEKRRRNA